MQGSDDGNFSYRVQRREERFDIGDFNVSCFVRNTNMRSSVFEMQIMNISVSGASLKDVSLSTLVFAKDSMMAITLDLSGKIFSRPIFALYSIKNVAENERGDRLYGLVMISIDEWHRAAYDEGFKKLISNMKHHHA